MEIFFNSVQNKYKAKQLMPFCSVERNCKRNREGKKENQTKKIRDTEKKSTTRS
jgi:hypothetical protein